MTSNHWSRSDMAKIADVSPTSVTNWFKRQTISKESASRLAQAARVSLAWILTGENEAGAGLSEDEEALIRVFRELPPIEQRNMLAAFQMRIQFLREYYANNADPVTRNK
ncbi:helix-turn-helix domain-containing protein [Salmonella enterica subsp. enterica]|nr:helix-turn-helix domain-containing protein [Salmonella enterica subsp. enterica]EDV3448804.1 helix-turn-helix domain-containing protein [Salmonella enterica subsp. enterica]EDV9112307.1 helix-turn-helix domain-containing protein [Salmonella enterica subsp. enterica]EDV9393410.1 helix-turn-helix domain-containing protein [Salmonella enterica subsp. enterica]HAV0413647.1 helix-turn-helix domain-containing protein [Salmonella enterica]